MIWQMIEDWFRGILTDGILSNLSGLFDSVNTEVGEIATQVGTTPAGWNAGIFNMIRSLSENVIVPIAGVIITFVMCYELIQLVIEKNNLHDLDTWIFFKWIFKTFVAVLLVTNTWNIVMGVFDITQSVVNDSAGVIISDTSIDIATVITDIEAKLDAMSVGGLLGLWFQSLFVGLTMKALSTGIAKGSDSPADFMRGIEEMTAGLVKTYSAISEDKAKLFTPQREAIGTCPRCGAAVYEGKKNFYCSDRACSFVMWKNDRFFEQRKKAFTKAIAAALLKDGKVKIKGMYSTKTGKTFDGVVLLADTGGKYVNFRVEQNRK